MSKNDPIGVFDSGVGGLTVLDTLMEYYPYNDFYYIADHGHCPYGIKDADEIKKRVLAIGNFLISKKVKAIVIACNTASLFVNDLAKISPVPVISVIKPTADYALKATNNNRIGVIATNATIKSGTYQKLFDQENVFNENIPCSEFVNIIENNEIDNPLTDEIIKTKLSLFLPLKIDTLVLGCTHFGLLVDKMKKVLGPINYIDSGLPTSKMLLNHLTPLTFRNKRFLKIYTTGEVTQLLTNMKWFKKEYDEMIKIDI